MATSEEIIVVFVCVFLSILAIVIIAFGIFIGVSFAEKIMHPIKNRRGSRDGTEQYLNAEGSKSMRVPIPRKGILIQPFRSRNNRAIIINTDTNHLFNDDLNDMEQNLDRHVLRSQQIKQFSYARNVPVVPSLTSIENKKVYLSQDDYYKDRLDNYDEKYFDTYVDRFN